MPLRLPSIFSDHAVLQQGRSLPVWGWDEPRQRVSVRLGGQEKTTVADPGGRWMVRLGAVPAGGPYTLEVEGSSTLIRSDLLVGEVWIASGQSNMEWPLSAADHWAQERVAADRPNVRLFKAGLATAFTPQDDVAGSWAICSPTSAAGFSAVAYYFGTRLTEQLGVPVGLIHSAWGGTRVEAWTSDAALRKVMDLESDLKVFPSSQSEMEQMAKSHLQAFTEWEGRRLPADPGNTGLAAGWASPGLDDSGWTELSVPGFWQTEGWDHNGTVWYRRNVTLPPGWVGKDLVLSLGRIDDYDWAYVNGVPVGSNPKGTPAAYQIDRAYPVPANLTRTGKLTIAVRVFDHFGQGGFTASGRICLAPASGSDAPLPLEGPWKAKVEHAIPKVPADVFRDAPPMPYMLQVHNRATALYNAMIHPLVPYALRGAIWYQGESNVDKWDSYRARFTAMIRDWRARWGQGTFPFLFVQLANFSGGAGWPYLQEAQAQTLSEPNTGMALAVDIGVAGDVHPTNKHDVGHRLAAIALARTYGKADVVDRGPSIASVEIDGERVALTFDCHGELRTSDGTAVRGFEWLDEAGVPRPATAQFGKAGSVALVVPAGSRVAGVRYAFADNPLVNLTDDSGLPAEPFRTDGL